MSFVFWDILQDYLKDHLSSLHRSPSLFHALCLPSKYLIIELGQKKAEIKDDIWTNLYTAPLMPQF